MTIHTIAQMVQASIADFLEYAEDGSIVVDDRGRPRFDLERARQLGKLHLIEEITIGDDGSLRIKLPKRSEALALLAKFHGLLADRVTVDVRTDDQQVRAEILAKLGDVARELDERDRAILSGTSPVGPGREGLPPPASTSPYSNAGAPSPYAHPGVPPTGQGGEGHTPPMSGVGVEIEV